MKNLLSLLILIIISASMAYGQENESLIDWGPMQEHTGIYRVMSVTDNYVFVMHRGRVKFFDWNLQILKFDKKNKEIEESIKVGDLFEDDILIVDSKVDEDSMDFLVFNDNGDKPKLELMKFSTNPVKFLGKEKVISLRPKVDVFNYNEKVKPSKVNKMVWLDELVNWTEKNNSVQFALSKDKSKIIFKQRTKKGGDCTDYITVMDRNNYSVLNELKIKDDAKVDTEITNIRVDEKNQIFVLQRVDLTRAEKKRQKKSTGHDLELIKKEVGAQSITLRMGIERNYNKSSDLLIDKSGNSFVLFLHGIDDEEEPEGVAIYRIDSNNEIIYKKHNTSSFLEKDEDHLDENFKIVHSFISEDRLVVMYRHLLRKGVPQGKNGNHHLVLAFSYSPGHGFDRFQYKDLIVEIFDKESNLKASNIIHHHGKCTVSDEFLRYDVSHDENGFWTTTNIHADTYEKILKGEKKSKRYPNKNNIITKIVFDYDGNYELQTISPEANLMVSRISMVTHNGLDYFIGCEQNGSNVQLGVRESNK